MEKLRSWWVELNPRLRKQLLMAFGIVGLLAGVLLSQNSQSELADFKEQPSSITKISGEIFVHVVGEVENPGLYELSGGSRVPDAIAFAGGMTGEAVQDSVNLARMLSDGEQVVVLAKSQMAGDQGQGFISLNRASASQLESLSGVGPALAGRIIEYREKIGSFADLSQLREVSGIGQKLFDSISKQLSL